MPDPRPRRPLIDPIDRPRPRPLDEPPKALPGPPIPRPDPLKTLHPSHSLHFGQPCGLALPAALILHGGHGAPGLHLGQHGLPIFPGAPFPGPPGPPINPRPPPGSRPPIGPSEPHIMPCGPERPGAICDRGPRRALAGAASVASASGHSAFAFTSHGGTLTAAFSANNASPPNKRTAITAHKAIFLTILHPFQTKTFFTLTRRSKQQDATKEHFIADMIGIVINHPPTNSLGQHTYSLL